ncbi:MAG: NUDIX domain-containing protein [Nanoarchaeota archaeon]|nr:NUDIX domain-containing protein [Nanoarchaeota archaeon]
MNRRASVIILRDKEVLLVKLKDLDKALPRSTWVFPFVELEENESPRKAINDLLREFGINYSLRKEIFKYVPSENPKLNYVVYVVDYAGGEPNVTARFQTYKWVKAEDIIAYSTTFMDTNISNYLKEIASKPEEI